MTRQRAKRKDFIGVAKGHNHFSKVARLTRVTGPSSTEKQNTIQEDFWDSMVRVQPETSREIVVDDEMDYSFQQFGSSENGSLSGMRRIVMYILYGVLVLLLLILLMVTGIKFSQLNKGITDVKLQLEKNSRGGGASLSTSAALSSGYQTAVQKPAAVKGVCREGWVSFQSKCYLMSTSTVTWSKAESLCQSVRGHLLVLNSVEELDFISNVAEARYSYWIGLVEHEEGHWTWVDGTDFNTTPTYWDEGQPDDWSLRVNGEDCGQLHPSYRNQRKLWNDADCGQQYYYICESES
ncbi:hepatic lectin-like [Echeneis naucrates]|uniref:hepatic lectin-like n=1 Tax=Echeneis naucrates TaxID=173247 RepID=UPI00111394E6|nr:hepatic lectin-like [Echeneis naucrates]